MSFKLPSFNFQAIQDSISKVDLEAISKSIQNLNPGKAVSEYSEHFIESVQPLTAKTQLLIASQVTHIQQLANAQADSGVEVSELPEDYVQLETSCDLLLKLYTDLIHYTDETYGTPSYDYPPGNTTISKLKDANVGLIFSSKFNQLKNVATPQDMEKVLLGQLTESTEKDTAEIQVTPAILPKTLYGRLARITSEHSRELSESESPLGFALMQVSSTYVEIASARLDQDKAIMTKFNTQLVSILNDQFIRVNELRKKVYAARSEFDVYRASVTEESEDDEKLIEKEDDFVGAIELAVVEMRKLLTPSQSINLLKVFAQAQKDFFDLASSKLSGLITELSKVETAGDDE